MSIEQDSADSQEIEKDVKDGKIIYRRRKEDQKRSGWLGFIDAVASMTPEQLKSIVMVGLAIFVCWFLYYTVDRLLMAHDSRLAADTERNNAIIRSTEDQAEKTRQTVMSIDKNQVATTTKLTIALQSQATALTAQNTEITQLKLAVIKLSETNIDLKKEIESLKTVMDNFKKGMVKGIDDEQGPQPHVSIAPKPRTKGQKLIYD